MDNQITAGALIVMYIQNVIQQSSGSKTFHYLFDKDRVLIGFNRFKFKKKHLRKCALFSSPLTK